MLRTYLTFFLRRGRLEGLRKASATTAQPPAIVIHGSFLLTWQPTTYRLKHRFAVTMRAGRHTQLTFMYIDCAYLRPTRPILSLC